MVIFQLEGIRHHSFDIDLATIEICHSSGEAVRLRERADDLEEKVRGRCLYPAQETYLDLVPEYFRRGPMHQGFVLVDTVDHQGATSSDIIDRFVGELLDTGRLYDHVEPILLFLFQLLPLYFSLGRVALEFDVFVSSVELLGDVHFDSFVRGDDEARGAVELEELREDEPGRARAEEENLDADGGRELVEAVYGAGGGFEERRFFICEVLDFV